MNRGWEAPTTDVEAEAKRIKRYRKAMALKEELGLSSDERYELAGFLPGVDDTSWKTLTAAQLHDLITMMEGFLLITYLFSQRLDKADDEN